MSQVPLQPIPRNPFVGRAWRLATAHRHWPHGQRVEMDGPGPWRPVFLPCAARICRTILMFQGTELPHVVVYLDAPKVPAGAYTAISRGVFYDKFFLALHPRAVHGKARCTSHSCYDGRERQPRRTGLPMSVIQAPSCSPGRPHEG